MPTAFIALQSGTGPANTFRTWNTLADHTLTGAIADLDDETGAATGWSFSVTNAMNGAGAQGVNSPGSGAASWVDEAIASAQYHYVDAAGDAAGRYTFGGLNDAKTYSIEVYGSRITTTGTRIGEWSVDGFSTVAGELECNGNNSQTVTIPGVSPASGLIALDVRIKAGSTFAYMNAVRIMEQATAALNPYIHSHRSGHPGNSFSRRG